MMTRRIFILLFLLALGSGAGAEDGLLPPPVDVQFTESRDAGQALRLSVTASEAMHVDISCLLPEGVALTTQEGVALRPCDEGAADPSQTDTCREAVVLWIGPLAAGEKKEFLLGVKVLDQKSHVVVARIQALARWGLREERVTLGAV